MSRHGIHEQPGLDLVPHSRFHQGRFGRLFRNLGALEPSDAALSALADVMVDQNPPGPSEGGWQAQPPDPSLGDNPDLPAGYTYLGQFIDHDITFDPTSSLQRANDPDALHNFRTPRFDLDSVYGEGPDDEPFLYEQPPHGEPPSGRMLLGRVGESDELDLPRNKQGVALIGDPRNDENVIVSQLQLLFLRAHNRLVDALNGDFNEARRQLRWHYQHIVINDFLVRVTSKEVVSDLLESKTLIHGPDRQTSFLKDDLDFFGWSDLPFMPVEFSVAAYRFGHSMIRPIYDLNDAIRDRPIFDAAGQPGGGQDLRGFQALLPGWTAQWSFFFPTGGERPQASRLIDIRLAPGLASLPFASGIQRLAERNLRRGKALGLPSGEAVARRMGITPLTTEEVALAELGVPGELQAELAGKTPLWFYALREAERLCEGRRLGPVGGRIVAETLVGLSAGDPFSYLNIEPNWTPAGEGRIPQAGERFEMADLVRFAAGA